jgi:DNA-binding HxlR family transcriptional regulator
MGKHCMEKSKRSDFMDILRRMSKKGFYETLEFVSEKGSVHYGEILKYDLENHIVQSRATVTLIVRGLSNMKILKRTVMDTRPIRTIYQPTEKGLKLLKHLKEIEKL